MSLQPGCLRRPIALKDATMDEQIKSPPTLPTAYFDRVVCDTDYCSRNRALSLFRETISNTFMPWILEFKPEEEFSGRVEGLILNSGAVARVKMSPATAVRTNLELARSPVDCLYANYVISGELNVTQCGKVTTAKQGGLVVYVSSQPVTKSTTGSYEDLAFRIPKTMLAGICDPDAVLNNVSIPAGQMISPLSSCLAFLSQHLLSTSHDELTALYEVCTQLLPVAAAHLRDLQKGTDDIGAPPSFYMRELADFINTNIGNVELSPHLAAEHLGISVRYVHKQFSTRGTTFGTYVTAKRLELVRRDLTSQACRNQPIFVIAYRWGFNDLSTFIRAFKKRFSCSPSQYRSNFKTN
jgi:AraC family transcriptional activator of tynA and feaB